MNYETIVGLEIHAELKTKSKIFCSCTTEFGGDVNTHCCPVCLGLPGSLPVVNKNVLNYAIKTGLAFNCEIAEHSKMDRKNYFYPDLVKAYQISQYDKPLCYDGHLDIETDDGEKQIGIIRIHIEEDTGKSLHGMEDVSLLDYNRSGVPLIEIVTHPDISSPEEAGKFLDKLKSTLEYLGVSDVKMEQGSLRCDVNINVKSEEGQVSGISEIKNLNSFKAVQKAIDFERKRQIALLEKGENSKKETRRWNTDKEVTEFMRSKEGVADYRYFPEPDLVDFEISRAWVEEIQESLPELPHAKKLRFMEEYEIPEYDAEVLVANQKLANYFEQVAEKFDDYKMISNWFMTELLRRVDTDIIDFEHLNFSAEELATLLTELKEEKISHNAAKKVFRIMFEKGKDPKQVIEDKGLKQISDDSFIEEIVNEVLEENPQAIEDIQNGKDRAIGYLVGQVMKKSQGKANPQKVNELIRTTVNE
jgi:aspartyl-tRNA(Asn)/glutamyl-tRNA(Gln) amidotransferase subunit B